jgi:hypothetical protein
MRDELLNGELLDTLDEAKALAEAWRRTYNRIRPHSSLGYRPPAPEALWDLIPENCATENVSFVAKFEGGGHPG